jgi:hypothetical protein
MSENKFNCTHCNGSGTVTVTHGERIRTSTPCFNCTAHAIKEMRKKVPDLVLTSEFETFQALLYRYTAAGGFREVMTALIKAIPELSSKQINNSSAGPSVADIEL